MASFTPAKVTNDATPGVWTELFASDGTRNGAAVQNTDAASNVYIYPSLTKPSDGSKDGELTIPPANAYYKFDFIPGARWWVRSGGASSVVTVWTW